MILFVLSSTKWHMHTSEGRIPWKVSFLHLLCGTIKLGDL